ncbi:MAG TPA: metal-dependent hydrolase [Gemmatimonadaceae bacterium]|nr:metal-dependent hydrolase [Gemmatimonadaceae bacterium]
MDNLCHTLVGAALAEAGLKRRTTLGAATLMIGANLPDIDVLAVPFGYDLAFRRGLTHGLPALLVLPLVLTGLMLAWHRVRPRRDAAPPRAGPLLLLSAVSIATHPVLDWMNTYGMRWFVPFRDGWTYGDALFIIDPWIWIALALGVIVSRRRRRKFLYAEHGRIWDRIPARIALLAVAAYIVAMIAASRTARSVVSRLLADRGTPVQYLMVDPVPLDPFRRRIVYSDGSRYVFSTFSWRRTPWVSEEIGSIAINRDDPLAQRAASTPEGRRFLGWSRLPFFVIDRRSDSALVHIGDARYTRGVVDSWAAVSVMVPVR